MSDGKSYLNHENILLSIVVNQRYYPYSVISFSMILWKNEIRDVSGKLDYTKNEFFKIHLKQSYFELFKLYT